MGETANLANPETSKQSDKDDYQSTSSVATFRARPAMSTGLNQKADFPPRQVQTLCSDMVSFDVHIIS